MCSGIETDCFFFFIRGLGWPTFFTLPQSEASDGLLFFTLPQSEASDELLFLLYLNQRPRMGFFFYFTPIRGLGWPTFFTLPQSEASDEHSFFTLLQSEASDELLFLLYPYPRPQTNVFSLNRKIAPRRITIAGQSELTANITKFTKRCCVYHPGLLGSSFGFFSISSAGMGQR